MQARMNHPVMVVPDAMKALQALGELTKNGLSEKLLELVHLRASQINGCSVCVDMHPKLARKAGETDERLFAVAAWRETPYFTEAERAYCDSRPNPAQHYAARFAGKEAVGKALGFGVARAFAWREIEIAGRPKPSVRLSGSLKASGC